MPASFFSIRRFAAFYVSSASFALSRSYIAIIRSSFSTSVRGSSAILSINAKTIERLSDSGADTEPPGLTAKARYDGKAAHRLRIGINFGVALAEV